MSRLCVAALLLAVLPALPGCGQKGALYLPQKPQPVQPQTPATPTPPGDKGQ
jgi:predicted small lipoprotein YifL